jgi:hypothetical protein
MRGSASCFGNNPSDKTNTFRLARRPGAILGGVANRLRVFSREQGW